MAVAERLPEQPARAILRNRWLRIFGIAFVMYILSIVDRVNIAIAAPAMRAELALTPAALGFAAGFFPWGYVILQIPLGRLAGVWSAKRVILIQVVLWSAVAASTALVHSEIELILNRFLLGVTEGGVLTCTIVLIRAWFTRAERARANTLFLMSIALGPVVANPISEVVLHYVGWRSMFIIEAIPTLLWGLVWWWAIDDRPQQARWLPAARRQSLIAELEAEHAEMAAVRSEFLPPAVAGVGIGLINGTGNLGGVVGPYFFGYIRTITGNFSLALLVGGASLVIGSLIAVPIRRRR